MIFLCAVQLFGCLTSSCICWWYWFHMKCAAKLATVALLSMVASFGHGNRGGVAGKSVFFELQQWSFVDGRQDVLMCWTSFMHVQAAGCNGRCVLTGGLACAALLLLRLTPSLCRQLHHSSSHNCVKRDCGLLDTNHSNNGRIWRGAEVVNKLCSRYHQAG